LVSSFDRFYFFQPCAVWFPLRFCPFSSRCYFKASQCLSTPIGLPFCFPVSPEFQVHNFIIEHFLPNYSIGQQCAACWCLGLHLHPRQFQSAISSRLNFACNTPPECSTSIFHHRAHRPIKFISLKFQATKSSFGAVAAFKGLSNTSIVRVRIMSEYLPSQVCTKAPEFWIWPSNVQPRAFHLRSVSPRFAPQLLFQQRWLPLRAQLSPPVAAAHFFWRVFSQARLAGQKDILDAARAGELQVVQDHFLAEPASLAAKDLFL